MIDMDRFIIEVGFNHNKEPPFSNATVSRNNFVSRMTNHFAFLFNISESDTLLFFPIK